MKQICLVAGAAIVSLCLGGCASSQGSHCVFQCSFDKGDKIKSQIPFESVDFVKDLEFVEGVDGYALCVKKGTMPLCVKFAQHLPDECGKIEYWAKLDDPGRMMPVQFFPMSVSGWYIMNRITTNTGAGTSGWQCSAASFHLYQFNGCGARPLADVFGALDPNGWHHYETIWNINGIASDPDKVVSFRIDGKELLSASKANLKPESFRAHLRSSRNLGIGGDPECDIRSTVNFFVDDLKIWDIDTTAVK